MINKDNLKDLLKALNFEEKGKVFSKHFPDTDAYLKVDFSKSLLVYPTDKNFTVNSDHTINFDSPENFVVFECVHRLFTKGYKPEHIELEPKWKVGHGASGGRADILVKDNSGKSLLIIECKTEGSEFKKEWNNTLQRGGQMLTYAKQAGTTQYVCLYASDFVDSKVIPYHYIISLNDNEKLLEELADKKPLSFKEAKSLEVEDIYKAWKETYNLDFATKGIFEDDIQPYQIGKQKYTITDLEEIGSKDIQSKYHEFATIMRQHNVSGRENAFNKLVNLFLCKIVDEAKNPKDLKFNWKGIAYDSYFDLQDRLQLLYQAGMKEFLGEDVTYIDNTSIDKAFRFFKKDPDATRETIKKYFRQLKFFTNNDFAFIDVHNEKLFYQNSEVLLKIVQMLQDTRLQTENQNQFLGDMFEGFLDNGVKQSEGQFFTPMPIVKFILNSLPLESIIQESELPPKAIDYACGAGHFLNELALQIKPFVKKHKETDIKEYYKEIVGIEKEYRLSKVAKVSAFMYGQDDIKITYADALGSKSKLHDNEYSVLVANPPYAVKGFLQTLSETERKSFTLFGALDEKSLSSTNSIETFFIERAKQLLKPGAVAGIILPSSILNNDGTLYINTREILIKYFQIVAITEFGSQTFGKTGTNTVTLFLRRKEENPAPADHWRNRVDAWFADNVADAVYSDSNYISNYCNHIEVDITQYKTLLTGKPSEELLKTEIFVDYKKAFDNLTEIKNLKKPKSAFSKKTKAEQETELQKRFTDYLQAIEKDKLYFFVLASENKQKVLVVKCPTDNKEQKQFLGYEWSSAKGNEGIKYINQSAVSTEIEDAETKEMINKLKGLHNINSPLYNPNNRNDHSKINHYIQQNFLGKELTIAETLIPYVSYYSMADLLDFSRTTFNKPILLTPKRNTVITSQWELVKLENLMEIGRGASPRPIENFLTTNTNGVNWIKIGDVEAGAKYITKTEEKITEAGAEKSRRVKKGDFILSNSMSFGRPYILKIDGCIHDGWLLLSKIDKRLNQDYLYQILSYEVTQMQFAESALGGVVKNLNTDRVKSTIIPLPTKEIQEKIVRECQTIDDAVENSFVEIEKAKKEISLIFKGEDFDYKKLNEVVSKQTEQIDPSQNTGDVFYVGLENIESNTGILVGNPLTQFNTIKSNKNVYKKGDLLYGKLRPNLNKLYLAQEDGICSTDILVFRCNDAEFNKFYAYYLRTKKFNDEVVKTVTGQQLPRTKWSLIETIKVPVPKDKKKIIKQIEKLEQAMIAEQSKIDSSADKKKEIMKKYL